MADVVVLSGDLFVTSQLSVRLAALGHVKAVAKLELVEAELAAGASVVVIDLSSSTNPRLVTDICESRSVTVVAFGPHVQEARLAAAKRAGCDLVITRGQMMREGDRLIDAFLKR